MTAGRSGHLSAQIDPARLAQLNAGTMEAATLTECLAVDFGEVMHAAVPGIGEDAVATMRH